MFSATRSRACGQLVVARRHNKEVTADFQVAVSVALAQGEGGAPWSIWGRKDTTEQPGEF